MKWQNREGQANEEKFRGIEKEFGLSNLQDIEVDESVPCLYVYTDTKKYQVNMTEV